MNVPRIGYRRRRYPITRQVRGFVKARDGRRCVRCGATSRLTIHHIRPLSAGGAAMDPANMETLCRKCHDAEHHFGLPS